MPAGMPAYAQWVEFQACGHDETQKAPNIYRHFMPAPNLGRFALWAPSVSVIAEMRIPPGAVACTGIFVIGQRYLVVGDFATVHCKIAPEGPYCKEAR